MTTMSFRVLGVPEVIARFARAAVIGEEAADVAAEDLAMEIATLAKQLAPVDTGTLRDSITAEPGGVFVYAPYAMFVEYGTVDTPAQPYLRPAVDTVNADGALVRATAMLDAA